MPSSPVDDRILNDGSRLPAIGLGTFSMTGPSGVDDVVDGIEQGYRLLDTAHAYGNEAEVGEGMRRSPVPRSELTVTSKLRGRDHGYDDAIRSVRDSIERLGVDRIDLHLVHWPNPRVGRFVEAWRALVQLRDDGLVRSIGVSNFTEDHLRRVIDATGVIPAVNQIEIHPAFPQEEMVRVDAELGIATQAWSPLGNDRPMLDHPVLVSLAERHGRTTAQVVLRWHLQRGLVPIPRSRSHARRAENLAVFDFVLTDEDMRAIARLARSDGRLFGGDPDTHEDM